MPLDPLCDFSLSSQLVALPKADLHLHQEERGRFGRIVARRQGRPLFDQRAWLRNVLSEVPPGLERLSAVYASDEQLGIDELPATEPENIIAKIVDVLEEGAADGAILIEIRFGTAAEAIMRPDFMHLFRAAERQAQLRFPQLYAEAIGYIRVTDDPAQIHQAEGQVENCLRLAQNGLAGVDFSTGPYASEAAPIVWTTINQFAERARDAGLGITIHVGEFSTANLASALQVPGVTRLGHAVYAASEPYLLEQLALSGVTVECSLTCNVILGAVASYEEHPIQTFKAQGIPVTLNTDLPVHTDTTIGREYGLATALGFSLRDLTSFTHNAIQASFTTESRRRQMLDELSHFNSQFLTE